MPKNISAILLPRSGFTCHVLYEEFIEEPCRIVSGPRVTKQVDTAEDSNRHQVKNIFKKFK